MAEDALIPFIKESFPVVFNTQDYDLPLTQYQRDTLTQLVKEADENWDEGEDIWINPKSPLHYAAETGRLELIQLLVDLGVSTIAEEVTLTMMDSALNNGQMKAVELLCGLGDKEGYEYYDQLGAFLVTVIVSGIWQLIPIVVHHLKAHEEVWEDFNKWDQFVLDIFLGPPTGIWPASFVSSGNFTRANTVRTIFEVVAPTLTREYILQEVIALKELDTLQVFLQNQHLFPPSEVEDNVFYFALQYHIFNNASLDIVGVLLLLLVYMPPDTSAGEENCYFETLHDLALNVEEPTYSQVEELLRVYHGFMACNCDKDCTVGCVLGVGDPRLLMICIRRGIAVPLYRRPKNSLLSENPSRCCQNDDKTHRTFEAMTRIMWGPWTPNPAHSDFYSPEFKLHLLHIAIAWRYLFADPYQLKDLPFMPLEILFRICSFVRRTWFANPTGCIAPRIIDRCIESMTSL